MPGLAGRSGARNTLGCPPRRRWNADSARYEACRGLSQQLARELDREDSRRYNYDYQSDMVYGRI